MKLNYKPLGDYVRQVIIRNTGLQVKKLIGVSMNKMFIESVANINGVDFENYKVIKKNQFACKLMSVGRDKKLPVDLLKEYDEAIVSSAYYVFEVIDKNVLLPEYLMMWFRRSESDRYVGFISGGDVRGGISWDDLCTMPIIVPDLETQKEIVKEYNTIINRIELNNQLIQKLEETAQTIYKQWFVDFEFPDENGNPYKSSGGEMEYNEELDQDIPKGWEVGKIGDYTSVKSGFAFKSEWWTNKGIPVIKIGSINNNSISYTDLAYVDFDKLKKASKYLVKRGDVVIAMTGATIGKIGLVPNIDEKILVNQRVGLFDLGENPIKRNSFLYFTLLQDYVLNEIHNVGGDSAQANISNGQIEDIFMIKENQTITNFNKLFEKIMLRILATIEENNLNNNFKQILLSKMSKIPVEVIAK